MARKATDSQPLSYWFSLFSQRASPWSVISATEAEGGKNESAGKTGQPSAHVTQR